MITKIFTFSLGMNAAYGIVISLQNIQTFRFSPPKCDFSRILNLIRAEDTELKKKYKSHQKDKYL